MTRRNKFGSVLVAGALGCAAISASPITSGQSAGLNLGSFSNYAIIDLGSGTTFGWNTGPVNGNVLVGNSVTVSLSSGDNGGVGAGDKAYTDGTAAISGALQSGLSSAGFTTVATSLTALGASTALGVSNYASTQLTSTVGTTAGTTIITSSGTAFNNAATTIAGNGGLNVINLSSVQNSAITFSGGANDYFVINVSGELQTNQTMTLSGVSASHILWNFTDTQSTAVLQTSGGGSLVGTFLATDGGQFAVDAVPLNGELIDTKGNVQFVSNASVTTQSGFTVPTSTPEPASFSLMLGAGLLVIGFARRRTRRA